MATSKSPTVVPARPRRAIVAAPVTNAQPLPVAEAQAASAAAVDVLQGEKVDVYVPKPFKFTLDDHRILDVNIGVQPMPKAIAEHWFVKAQGVVVYDRTQH